jgi:chromodomain-helicase-DNA-binding protein 7
MKATRISGPFLIIAPLSLIDQWQSEVGTWSPNMNCVLLHGNQQARETIVSREFYYQEPYVTKAEASALKKGGIYKFHILLTTFENAVKEISTLCKIPWEVMIIDEAHKLKNAQSRIFQTLSNIKTKHCVLLTGTPLQNKTEELWALLNFAEPSRFNDLNDFLTKFGDLKSAHQVANLHEMLKPYLLRRIKEDVEKSLPPKEETIVEVALTSIQKRFYRAIYEKNTSFLFKGVRASNQPSLMNVMMELRKCCNHPYLVRGVEERIHDELTPEESQDPEISSKKLIESCGKLVLLDKLLPRLFSQGHKVLIFSQMVRVLNLLEEYLRHKNYSFERLDGSTRSSDRKEAVERFCKPSLNRFIMLLSTKAGGLGLNLTAADTVIIYDSDWNPQNDLQAQARAHRIGQTRSVMVYRLLTRKTYEMEMFHQASMKLGLDRAVLAHARQEKSSDKEGKYKLSAKEIDELLKKGAYDVFREDDTEQNEFVEADIDAILQRRSHKLVYDGSKSNAAQSLGSFSKASFVSADAKEDVDINDPDFWKKAIGLTETPGGVLYEAAVVEELPQVRVRKQVKGYNDEPLYTEDQLNEYLKPISQAKLDKQARAEAAEKKRQEKEEQRLQVLREKQEREEARRLKSLEEARVRADPRFWGAHGRDRLLRSLLAFGYGRWDRIRGEAGKPAMDLGDLESFCRCFIVQCGIVIMNDKTLRSEPRYVFEAIETAKILLDEEKQGILTIDLPPILTEDRFIAKLRNGGMAKKSLGKLDVMARLYDIIKESLAKLCQEHCIEVDDKEDIDRIFSSFTVEEIMPMIPLGDIRPAWTRSCPWWDFDCDRHLLIGVFRHGMGRYDQLRKDPDLVFCQKIRQFMSSKHPSSSKLPDGEDNFNEEVDESAIVDTSSQMVAVDGIDESSAKNLEPTASSTNLVTLGGNTNENDDGNDSDDAGDDEEKAGVGTNGNSGLSGEDMPDPRHLNRLLNWLVTSEQAKMFEADIVPITQEKRERKSRGDKKEKEKYSIAKCDRSDEYPGLNSISLPSSLSAHNLNLPDGDFKSLTKTNSSLNNGEVEQLESLEETELSNKESAVVGWLRHLLDIDSISMAMKNQIAGLKKCESILASTILASNSRSNDSARSTLKVKPSKADTAESVEQMDVDDSTPTKSGTETNPDVSAENYEELDEEDMLLTENDAVTLTATFILYGAPTIPFVLPSTYQQIKDWMGFKTNEDIPSELSPLQFDWSTVSSYCRLNLPSVIVERFYSHVWLPFCHHIIRRKSLSVSPNKFVVPNPLINLNEHHQGAKGLCQIFIIRQHLLRTISYVLNCNVTKLMDYLRSPAGRSVDNMPIWWCPWIHDLGILVGMLKYGFMKMDAVIADPELPFYPAHVRAFVQKVFISGCASMPAVARFDLASVQEAEDFIQCASSQFPEFKDLEIRVYRIIDEVTKGLPDEHPCRLPVSALQYRAFFVSSQGGAADNSNEAIQATGSNGLEGKKGEGRGSRTSARPPAMSLKTFVQTSRKRRKLYVTSYHPEAFSPEVVKLG